MKIRKIIQSNIRIGPYDIGAVKCLMNDFDVVLFLSTNSIKQQLSLDIASQGVLMGFEVCDLQTLFDAVEQSPHHKELYDIMDSSLNYEKMVRNIDGIELEVIEYPDGSLYVELTDILKYCTITRDLELPLLKNVCCTLEEKPTLSFFNAIELLVRRRKPKPKKKAKKGFAAVYYR